MTISRNFEKVLEIVDDMEITQDLPPRNELNDHPNVRSTKEKQKLKRAIKKQKDFLNGKVKK